MYKVNVKNNNSIITLKGKEGENLLNLLRDNNIYIPAHCGGRGTCNKCVVNINGNPTKSCNYYINSDIVVEIFHYGNNTAFDKVDEISCTIKNSGGGYGLAVDIGTTTLAVYLVHLITAKVIEAVSELNSQKAFGADVISRISFAGENGLDKLCNLIRNQIDKIKNNLCKKYGIKRIEKTVITGNNTMLHIYKGVNPSSIGYAPYAPVFTDIQYLDDNTILLPSASGYIGSDLIAGIVASGMYDNNKNCMLIDIGTNGEMVLKSGNKYYACATAAGPAFEGANIEMGTGGVLGAIDHIRFVNGVLEYTVIGDSFPIGLCGSALTDVISIFIENNIIDDTGLFSEAKDTPLKSRIGDDKFYICDNVYISQKDIREFQLAKSAIRAGFETLIKCSDIDLKSLTKLYIAGGFGYYLDKASAINTGILPISTINIIDNIGNSAAKGAIMCLVNDDYIEICKDIAKNTEVVDLSNSSVFYHLFIKYMGFGEMQE